jgi:orotidine-5'-phosphate decarboxylase
MEFNNKNLSAKDRLILALDTDSLEEVERLVTLLKDYVKCFKVGPQLFTSCAYDGIEKIKSLGGEVYFDGKFHDIPSTVAKAGSNLIKRGVTVFSAHLAGGTKMLTTTVKVARETAKKYNMPEPRVLGVTLLSSFGQRTLTEELNVKMNIDEYVSHLVSLAKESKIDGVIASASEAKKIRQEFGDDFIILCPAIRSTWSVVNDQIRFVTPADAVRAGVDYMVVGRPITAADDPVAAVNLILEEIEDAAKSIQVDRSY